MDKIEHPATTASYPNHLLPCPFCKGKQIEWSLIPCKPKFGGANRFALVKCKTCGGQITAFSKRPAEDSEIFQSAQNKWNTREGQEYTASGEVVA